MRSRYFGAARPRTLAKDWLADSFNADSYSRDQSKLLAIDPRPTETILRSYGYIDAQGYPYDLERGSFVVDMQANPTDTFYDLQTNG